MKAGETAPPRGVSGGVILRVLCAGSLVVYLLWLSDPRAVVHAVARAAWPPLLLVVALVLIDRTLMAYRWFGLLAPLGAERLPSRAAILRIFFVSTFVGTFLPASIGGDAARSFALARHGVPLSDSLASVFVDRMLGVLSLLIAACAGLLMATDLASTRAVIIGLTVTGTTCLVAAALVFSPPADRMMEWIALVLPSDALRRASGRILSSLRRYAHHRSVLTKVLGLSMAVQGLRIVQAALLGSAIGIVAPPQAYVAFVPLIMLIMLLPVTVNGLGTSQAAFVWFFSRVATPAHEAFALSVLFVGLQVVGNLPGALLIAMGSVTAVRDGHSRQ